MRTVNDNPAIAFEADVELVIDRVKETLGAPDTWSDPITLDSLAQCAFNSIFSTGNKSGAVIQVLDRYRALREEAGAQPAEDNPKDLVATIESLGGPDEFADALQNHWRCWQHKSAPYKTTAVYGAAQLLVDLKIATSSDLQACLGDMERHSELKRGWHSLPGQRSGLTWRYFLMTAGVPGIKADRMIVRWTETALGRKVSAPEAESVLLAAAAKQDVEARRLDRAIWSYQRSA